MDITPVATLAASILKPCPFQLRDKVSDLWWHLQWRLMPNSRTAFGRRPDGQARACPANIAGAGDWGQRPAPEQNLTILGIRQQTETFHLSF